MTDEPFTLQPPKPRRRPWKAEDRPRMRQGKLLSGTDCLPGQSELFAADGTPVNRDCSYRVDGVELHVGSHGLIDQISDYSAWPRLARDGWITAEYQGFESVRLAPTLRLEREAELI